jgi:hypothetical protein
VSETNCSRKICQSEPFCELDFFDGLRRAVLLRLASLYQTHHDRFSNSSTNLLPVSFFQSEFYFDGNERGSAHGPVPCRCVASRSIVDVRRRQAVGGRASYGILYRPLVRVLLDALGSCNLVPLLRCVRVDCDRWLGHLAAELAGRLLSDQRLSAVWELVHGRNGHMIGRLVPVRVRT